jgi:outer membrane protein insertion porin family
VFSQDFAGLGGSVKYLRTRANAAKFWRLPGNYIFSASIEGGYIKSFEKATASDQDPVRLIDRFYLGEPQIRGFDIRGVGPRIQRFFYKTVDGVLVPNRDKKSIADDPIGGRAYYLGRVELEVPVGSSVKELGLRPSVFVDVGALWGVRHPKTDHVDPGSEKTITRCVDTGGAQIGLPDTSGVCAAGSLVGGINPFFEEFHGDTPRPRVSVGFGINWNSPFGPFRIDIARALIKSPGDDTKLITFNVGTAF